MTNALYYRLSLADGDLGNDGKDESNSIENQRSLLLDYISTHEELNGEIKEYIDDGYSGTNFNRPGFKQMVEDAKKGVFQTIIVKDFSRLGRDYISVGDYLEQIFPILGIRFIAVNQNYDSNNYVGKTPGLDMSINNLVNHMYSRDLSKKEKSALEVKWKQGLSTYARYPYGYTKDIKRPREWIIDPVSSKVVRMIFDLAIQGKTTRQISEYLNEKGLETPGAYKNRTRREKDSTTKVPKEEQLWTPTIVRRVVKEYEYTGAIVNRKRQYLDVGSGVSRVSKPNEMIINENVHAAIITKDEYFEAQKIFRSRKECKYRVSKDYVLKGKLRCGNCGLALAYCEKNEPAMFCSHKAGAGKHSNCSSAHIPLSFLEHTVWYALHSQLLILKKAKATVEREDADFLSKKAELDILDKEIEHIKNEKVRIYEAYALKNITKEVYVSKKNRANEKLQEMEERKISLDALMTERRKIKNEVISYSSQIVETDNEERKLTKAMVDAFIQMVYVHDETSIDIVFTFDDVLKRVENITIQSPPQDTAE